MTKLASMRCCHGERRRRRQEKQSAEKLISKEQRFKSKNKPREKWWEEMKWIWSSLHSPDLHRSTLCSRQYWSLHGQKFMTNTSNTALSFATTSLDEGQYIDTDYNDDRKKQKRKTVGRHERSHKGDVMELKWDQMEREHKNKQRYCGSNVRTGKDNASNNETE